MTKSVSVSPTPRSGSLSRRIGLLLVVVLITWIAFAAGWRYLRAQYPSPIKVPVSPYSENVPPRIGNINGTKLSIPAQYLFFPVEYVGESVWEPRKDKPQRTFDSGIGNFAIYVQWPTLAPRNPKNEQSFQASVRSGMAHDWIRVGVVAQPKSRFPNGYANHVKYDLENKIKNHNPPGNPRYEMKGLDPKLGLNWAIPVGTGTDKATMWNMVMYWNGDPEKSVTTYIACDNGSFPNPNVVAECRQEFLLPELKVDIAASYKINLLPHWRAIEDEVRKLILSFQASQSNTH